MLQLTASEEDVWRGVLAWGQAKAGVKNNVKLWTEDDRSKMKQVLNVSSLFMEYFNNFNSPVTLKYHIVGPPIKHRPRKGQPPQKGQDSFLPTLLIYPFNISHCTV